MLRHDAFSNLDVMNGKTPEAVIPGMQFPLPVLGPHSPSVLTCHLLAKLSVFFVGYLFVLQLVNLFYPEVAQLIAKAISVIFAIALVVRWLSSDRGMPEWPVWIGAGLVVVAGAGPFFPDLDLFGANVSDQPKAVISIMIAVGVGIVVLTGYLSPMVRRVTTHFSSGELILGLFAVVEGARVPLGFNLPESDFGAWNMFPLLLLPSLLICMLIADQYVRFVEVMNSGGESKCSGNGDVWLRSHVLKCSIGSCLKIVIALWIGNAAFLASLNSPAATMIGIAVFILSIPYFSFLENVPIERYRLAWSALCFWLTYNLQRVHNPNAFQLRAYCREPLVRLGVVGSAVGFLGLALLYLSGVHAMPGSTPNNPRNDFYVLWNTTLPQCYPKLILAGDYLPESAKETFTKYAAQLDKEGAPPMATQTPVRGLSGMIVRAVLVLVGAPLLFIFLLANTQGEFLASVQRNRTSSSEKAK